MTLNTKPQTNCPSWKRWVSWGLKHWKPLAALCWVKARSPLLHAYAELPWRHYELFQLQHAKGSWNYGKEKRKDNVVTFTVTTLGSYWLLTEGSFSLLVWSCAIVYVHPSHFNQTQQVTDHQDKANMATRRHETRTGLVGRKGSGGRVGRRWWGCMTKLCYFQVRNSQRKKKERAEELLYYTYSLFFSLTLAPFLSNSSATCFRLGCKEATAQCCKSNKIQFQTNFCLNINSWMKEYLELFGTL